MKENSKRKNCKDVFNAFLVSDAKYDGELEIPALKSTSFIPNSMITFSRSISSKDYDQWVMFYEDDWLFERFWKNPNKYLSILSKYKGVILPDFSLYRDMPLVLQLWNIYRSRAIGNWLQSNGVNIIPNIRFGDERTFEACCLGIETGANIAIGTYGCMKDKTDRNITISGIRFVVKRICPNTLIIYGTLSNDLLTELQQQGVKVIIFESDFSKSRKVVKS